MDQSLGLVSPVVREYDAAIAFFVGTLGFSLSKTRPFRSRANAGSWSSARGFRRAPSAGACKHRRTGSRIGNQTGGRVFLFLHTDNFDRDYHSYRARGVRFRPRASGRALRKVAVSKTCMAIYGDLQPEADHEPMANASTLCSPSSKTASSRVLTRRAGTDAGRPAARRRRSPGAHSAHTSRFVNKNPTAYAGPVAEPVQVTGR